jgi:phosphoserine phosphatase
MLLRSFTKVKEIREHVELVTDEEANTTSVLVDGICVACYSGTFSETAENVYYQMLKNASRDGCTIS